mgnify:CR=1 FL=1
MQCVEEVGIEESKLKRLPLVPHPPVAEPTTCAATFACRQGPVVQLAPVESSRCVGMYTYIAKRSSLKTTLYSDPNHANSVSA